MEMEGGNQRKQIIYMWLISNEIIHPQGAPRLLSPSILCLNGDNPDNNVAGNLIMDIKVRSDQKRLWCWGDPWDWSFIEREIIYYW